MDTPVTMQPATTLSTEQKIDVAIGKAAEVVNMFSPVAAEAIAAGAEMEPVISSIVKMFITLFQHHIKKQG